MKNVFKTWMFVCLLAPVCSAGTPKIKFEQTVYNFGTTSLVATVSGVFAFENAGDAELEVKNVVPGCGCTATSIRPATRKLAPGEKGEISFKLDLGASRGRVKKPIAVTCNDPATPTVNLDIDVTVEAVLKAPSQVSLGEMSLRSATNFVVEVQRVDGQPFRLEEVRSTEPLIAAQLDEASRGTGTVARVLVNVKGGGPARMMVGHLNFFLPGIQVPAASTMVTARMVGDLRVVPQQVYWGIGDPAKWPGNSPDVTAKRMVRLSGTRSEARFEVGQVTSSLTNVTAEVVTEEKGKAYQVMLRLNSLTGQSQQGTVTIETTMPDYPQVTVPVFVFTGQRTSGAGFAPR
jgi:hypothetical protein